MYTIKALEEIEKSRGYEIALMTTFNIDVDFFERYIAGQLYSNDIKKIALFVDARELNKGIENTWKKSLLMGSRYSVNPVRLSGAFHPKVMLLLSHERAKFIISSANYTYSGYSTNNEIFNVFEIDQDDRKYLQIIKDAAAFFKGIYEKSYALDPHIMEEVESNLLIKQRAPNSADTFLLHNIDQPVLDQLKGIIGNPASIDIAVPFYDNNLFAVDQLKTTYPGAIINTYVQNHKSRFNVGKAKCSDALNIKPFTGFKKPASNSFYHGKVFRFNTDIGSWILYGSANCTGAAMCETPSTGGNIECCILEKGDNSEFDYFFESICLQDIDDIECDLLKFSSEESEGRYFFRYGEVVGPVAELKIGFNGSIAEAKVFLSGKEISCTYVPESKTIIAKIPLTEIPTDNDIFTVRIADDSGECFVKCWVYNADTLKLNRFSEAKVSFRYRYNPEAIGDDELEDIMNIMRITAIYRDDKLRKKEIIKTVQQAKEAAEDYEDAPEGIVDYVIPPRLPTADEMMQYENIIAARNAGRMIINSYFPRSSGMKAAKSHDTSANIGKRRQPTQMELRIKDFILSAVKEMLKENNLEITDAEDYLIHMTSIFRTMNKYTDDVVQGMYDLRQNYEIRIKLLEGFLKLKEGFSDVITTALFRMVVETHYLNKRLNKYKGLANYSEKPITELFLDNMK